jgi:hypothetical protein
MNDYGVNTQKVVLAGLLGVILAVAAIMALQVLYYRYMSGVEATEKFSEPSPKLQKLLAEQEERLAEYRRVDAEKGIVAIPIERAMGLVVEELSGPKGEDGAFHNTSAEEKHDAK